MRATVLLVVALLSGCRMLTGGVPDSGTSGSYQYDSAATDWTSDPGQALQDYQDVMDQRKEYLQNVQNGTIPITYPTKR